MVTPKVGMPKLRGLTTILKSDWTLSYFFFSIQCKISRPISKLKSAFTILAFLLYIYHFLFISLIVSTTSHELSKLYCLVNSGFYILAIPLKALS